MIARLWENLKGFVGKATVWLTLGSVSERAPGPITPLSARGGSPNASFEQVLPCYRVLGELGRSLEEG
jgi:hypothetical protein